MLGPPNKSVRSVSALSGSTGFSASAMKSSKVRQERNTNFKVSLELFMITTVPVRIFGLNVLIVVWGR